MLHQREEARSREKATYATARKSSEAWTARCYDNWVRIIGQLFKESMREMRAPVQKEYLGYKSDNGGPYDPSVQSDELSRKCTHSLALRTWSTPAHQNGRNRRNEGLKYGRERDCRKRHERRKSYLLVSDCTHKSMAPRKTFKKRSACTMILLNFLSVW